MKIPKKDLDELKQMFKERKKIEIEITDEETVESPEQWFVRQIWENTTFDCPACGGTIQRIILNPCAWRWTCKDCQRDFGVNTSKPLF